MKIANYFFCYGVIHKKNEDKYIQINNTDMLIQSIFLIFIDFLQTAKLQSKCGRAFYVIII